jgi:hypothetical protein
MNTWVYRTLMTILGIVIVSQLVFLATAKPQQTMCLNGIVMVQDKGGDMWVQRGLWATYCMPVDKD